MRTLCTLSFVCIVSSACMAQPRGDVTARPADPDWLPTDPASVGMDGGWLERMTADIQADEWGNVHAVLIARKGRLIHEAYFTGEDEHILGVYDRVDFGRDVKHGLRSVTKSFTATLVGIAIDQGLISSVDVTLSELLPEYSDILTGDKSGLTVRHLLTMSAGLRWNEGSTVVEDAADDQYALAQADDPVALVLGRESETPPGQAFKYSGGLTQVLAGILERVTGMSLVAYADSVLFNPLGIEDWEWITLGNAAPSAFSGLRLRARDMGKLGQVYLDNGRWKGRQVVSPAWVSQAVQPFLPAPSPRAPPYVEFSGYGFQWWFDLHRWKGRPLPFRSAIGNGGQRIMMIPELDLVVVIFAGFYDDPSKNWVPETIVREYILPAITEAR